MSFSPLEVARLTYAADGTPRSETFDDIYYSADGGPGQAQHVFLHGNDLPTNWADKNRFVILENGFGSGLNFLTTWAAWQNDPARPHTLHYIATEMHPFQVADLAKLHLAWPQLAVFAEALRNAWPPLLPGFHRLEFAVGRVLLTLLLGEAEASLRQLRASVDAFYLDGFNPQKNPNMWSASLLKRCGQLAAPNATVATWCVAGEVRRALANAGFALEKRPGYASKRQMLAGHLIPHKHPYKRPETNHPAAIPRHATVIGAGLAGCAIANRLAARGWQVDLYDRDTAPAQQASGNLAGIVRPLLSRDDSLASRINRTCFLHLKQALQQLDQAGFPARRKLDGLMQIAHDAEHEVQQKTWLEHSGFPPSFVHFLDQHEASRTVGGSTPFGGWWFPGGGWVNPPSLCRSWLEAGGANIRWHGGIDISHIERDSAGWQLLAANGDQIGSTGTLILASGVQSFMQPFSQIARLPIQPARGQVTHLPAGHLPALSHAICGEGYLTPAVDGIHCLGASYAKDNATELRVSEHQENLLRLHSMLPDAAQSLLVAGVPEDPNGWVGGRVGFRATTRDHLPLVGALPDLETSLNGDIRLRDFPRHPGLFGLLGLGSRGLVWAALLAEHLASLINQDPLPLPADQTEAVDPARFALRAHRLDR